MYLVEMIQGDRQHRVGLFHKKADARKWILSIPYVKEERTFFSGEEFINYTMEYHDLPLYEEIPWKKSLFPLSRYMFAPDEGPIEFNIWD